MKFYAMVCMLKNNNDVGCKSRTIINEFTFWYRWSLRSTLFLRVRGFSIIHFFILKPPNRIKTEINHISG